MPPEDEGSSPRHAYAEAHDVFLREEQKRASRFIQRAEGFIDLRDINAVRLEGDGPPDVGRPDRARLGNVPGVGEAGDCSPSKCILLELRSGQVIGFKVGKSCCLADERRTRLTMRKSGSRD